MALSWAAAWKNSLGVSLQSMVRAERLSTAVSPLEVTLGA